MIPFVKNSSSSVELLPKPTVETQKSSEWTVNNSSTSEFVNIHQVTITSSNQNEEKYSDENKLILQNIENLMRERNNAQLLRQQREREQEEFSVTSKDDLGFTAPSERDPIGVSTLVVPDSQLAPEGCGVPVKPSQTIKGEFNEEILEPVDIPSVPDLSFLSISDRYMIGSAYNVVNRLERWDYIRRYSPSNTTGYIFDRDPITQEIMNEIQKDYGGHSGCSIAITMRNIQYIAENGFEDYKQSRIFR